MKNLVSYSLLKNAKQNNIIRIINNPMRMFSINSGLLMKNIFDTLCDVYMKWCMYVFVCGCVCLFPHKMFIALIGLSSNLG